MNAKKILSAVMAVAAGAVISAFAGVPQLTATISGNDVSVTVPEGALDDTSALYLVWDDVDHGEKLADWPTENRILYSGSPAVSSSAETYTLSKAGVPSGAYMRIIATSNVRLIDGYVALNDTQYINTGVSATAAYGLAIKYRYIRFTGNAYASLMGGVLDNFTIGRYVYNGADRFYLRWRGKAFSNSFEGLATSTADHEISVVDGVAKLDGTQQQIGTLDKGAMGTIDRPVLLGATWSSTDPYADLSGRYCNAKWYYAKVLDASGAPLVDLVPALRGDTASQEAVLYDTVTGECFANAGTGTLDYSGNTTNTVAVAAAATDSLCNGRVAVWTGNGNPKDATDANNWSVTNVGIPVPGAIPGNGTKIAGCTLAADADWSALASTDTWVQPVEYADVVKGVYVDTGFCPDSNTRVVMDVTISDISNGKPYPFRLFAVYTNSYNKGAFCLGNDMKGLFSSFGNSGGTYDDTNTWIPVGRHTVDYDKGVVKMDGTATKTRAGTFVLDKALYLFLTNDKGTASDSNAGPFRFHSCQIYDNGTLVRDYVPVTVGGVAKIYDRKHNTIVEFRKVNGTEIVNVGAASSGRLGGDSVEIDGIIDLAGHTLTVGDLAGTGTITDSEGGELHVSVPAGFDVENDGITLAGSLKLVKEGAGMLVGAKAGQTYTGGTLVSGGRAKCAVADRPWGAALSLVTISDGATFDWAEAFTQTGSAYNFALAGSGMDGNGALVSTGLSDTWNVSTIANMELLGDALIGGYGGWGFANVNGGWKAHTLTMNEHTLSISLKGSGAANTGMFAFCNVTASGVGTIAFVNAMSARVYPSFFNAASDLSSVTLDLGDGYSINAEKEPTIGTFIDRRSVEATQLKTTNPITVLDCFKPMSANLVRTVTLGDTTHLSPVLDLSGLDAPFVVPSANYSMSMASGATVQIKLGDRKRVSRTPIITWDGEKPSWVDSLRFVRGDSNRQYGITVREDGIYAVSGLTITFY